MKLGIKYLNPRVQLAQSGRLDVTEIAGRTAYNSFNNSEHESIVNFTSDFDFSQEDIESSELLHSLAWVHHHHSVLEHINLTYIVQGTSRGVLQELVRHRLASYTVQSTRYTMSDIINLYAVSVIKAEHPEEYFTEHILALDMFVIDDKEYCKLEIKSMFNKLEYQRSLVQEEEFWQSCIPKSIYDDFFKGTFSTNAALALLSTKKKRNVGDNFKHIVSDNWKVNLVLTMNLRELKTFFTLRDSGAAYFGIRMLAQEMKIALPQKYKDLIIKGK